MIQQIFMVLVSVVILGIFCFGLTRNLPSSNARENRGSPLAGQGVEMRYDDQGNLLSLSGEDPAAIKAAIRNMNGKVRGENRGLKPAVAANSRVHNVKIQDRTEVAGVRGCL